MEPLINKPSVHLENNMMRNVSVRSLASSPRRLAGVIAVASFVVLMHADVNAAQPATTETFPSPDQAARALYLATRANDQNALTRILGSEKEAVLSEDPIADQAERERFVRKYQEMHRFVRAPDGAEILHIGAENWPFPFPLVSENGTWHFDADAGMQEVVLRRIGEDELAVIESCRTLATGRHNTARGSSGQSHGALIVKVANDNRLVPFHGYYFRRVTVDSRSAATGKTKQKSGATENGFTYVAYPAEYRVTGVMTFAVGQDGVLYEGDLGPNTVAVAKKIIRLDSSHGWHTVEVH
jgi:Protein of unknown function (DUF2950)